MDHSRSEITLIKEDFFFGKFDHTRDLVVLLPETDAVVASVLGRIPTIDNHRPIEAMAHD